jgi:archaellum component FlaC
MSSKPITLEDIYTGQQAMAQDIRDLKHDVKGLTEQYHGLSEDVQVFTKNYHSLSKDVRVLTSKLNGLTELVAAGFETMNDRFDRLEARVDNLETQYERLELRMGTLESLYYRAAEQPEQRTGNYQALYNDVVELYKMAAETKRHYSKQLLQDRALASRLQKVEVGIRKLAGRRRTDLAHTG